jgi:hypothetical protein
VSDYVSIPALVDALCDHADGICADVAAVGLIVGHGIWLRRRDFHRFIRQGHYQHAPATPFAYIRWRGALSALEHGQLACSSSEADILRIACSIGAGTPVRLRNVLGGLDSRNVGLVTDAITAANGT